MRADRLIALILFLQESGKSTSSTLAVELGVSRRTILRDLEALSFSGVPVLAEGGPGGGVWLDAAYRTTLTGMKQSELRTLLINSDSRLMDDLGWGDEFRTSQRKLKASLNPSGESGADFVRRRLLIDSRWWWHEAPDRGLEILLASVWDSKVIEGEYEAWGGERKTVQLEAYGLVAKAGLWYFIGRRDGEWRTYRVSRFQSVRVVGPFRRDSSFDLADWWPANAAQFAAEFTAYRFNVAIPQDQVRYLRGIAPGRVDLKGPYPQHEGWVEVEVGLDSQLYAELVVLGLGQDFHVLDKPELIEAVVKRASTALKGLKADLY